MAQLNRVVILGALIVLPALLVSRPALAQVDLSGEWAPRFHEDAPHRAAGPEIGDYTGLPINDAARLKAESWDASVLSLRERQCIPHVVTYALRGPANIRIWKDTDALTGQLTAYHVYGGYGRPRTIWLDGRLHPSDFAAHTWTGFSTGTWEGTQLTVTTTHIKMGWIQRNGVPTSDLATMTEHFIRHGELLTVVSVVNDPVYLVEPFIRTSNWVLRLDQQISSYGSCGPAQIADEVAGHPKGYVPHHLPGTNEQLRAFWMESRVPPSAAGGGVETVYPEYMRKLQDALSMRPDSASAVHAPARTTPQTPARLGADGNIEVLPVQGNVYLLAGAGGSIAVQVGDEGVLLVDTGARQMTDNVLAAVRRLSDRPIRVILNTQADPDHTGGNEMLAKAGSKVRGGNAVTNPLSAGEGASVIAHEQVLNAMSAPTGKQTPMPVGAWSTDTYFTDSKEVYFNGEPVQLLHQPAAHSGGDSIVFFRHSDVLVAGDVFVTTGYPVIDAQRGGSFSGVIDALNRLIDLAIPRDWQEGGTMVIPGHGRLADEADLVEYRDMLTIIRDRIRDAIKKGMTLEQVKAARPTRDYDVRYGSSSGSWTTDMFVQAAYRDLTRRR